MGYVQDIKSSNVGIVEEGSLSISPSLPLLRAVFLWFVIILFLFALLSYLQLSLRFLRRSQALGNCLDGESPPLHKLQNISILISCHSPEQCASDNSRNNSFRSHLKMAFTSISRQCFWSFWRASLLLSSERFFLKNQSAGQNTLRSLKKEQCAFS